MNGAWPTNIDGRHVRHVTREAFYAVACDPRRSVAVEACAGAGKTWMLVSRILRALLEEGRLRAARDPRHHLHRKAAGEMRERLRPLARGFRRALEPEALAAELVMRGVEPRPTPAAVRV
jgi:ATP-dependent helicase/nuclease subunit A